MPEISLCTNAAFDPLWKKHKNRTPAARKRRKMYRWLAGQLGMAEDDCHIGLFDIQMCLRVVEICKNKTPFTPTQTEE